MKKGNFYFQYDHVSDGNLFSLSAFTTGRKTEPFYPLSVDYVTGGIIFSVLDAKGLE